MTNDPDNTSDLTQNLSAVDMLRLVLADVREMKSKLAALESQAEDRARETRPKLDLIVKEISDLREEMAEVRKDLRRLDRTFSTFAVDHTRMRADIHDFDERLTDLERRPN